MNTLLRALERVASILDEIDARWVLAGSTASYLNGLKITPKDIDILTDHLSAYRIGNAFESRNFLIERRINYSETESYASHYGVFYLEDVRIEVIGDLIIKYKGFLIKVDLDELLSYSIEKQVRSKVILLVPLEWQLVMNALIPNKEERLEMIANYLKKVGYNNEILTFFLRKMPEEIKEKINELMR